MELHLHALFLVKQQQLITVVLPMHALAKQVTRYLPWVEPHGDVHLPATQQRHIWIKIHIRTSVIVMLVILLLS